MTYFFILSIFKITFDETRISRMKWSYIKNLVEQENKQISETKGGNNSYYNIWIEWRASEYYNDYSLIKLNGICHSMLLCMPNISNYYER